LGERDLDATAGVTQRNDSIVRRKAWFTAGASAPERRVPDAAAALGCLGARSRPPASGAEQIFKTVDYWLTESSQGVILPRITWDAVTSVPFLVN
jgi:hypothetical protein